MIPYRHGINRTKLKLRNLSAIEGIRHNSEVERSYMVVKPRSIGYTPDALPLDNFGPRKVDVVSCQFTSYLRRCLRFRRAIEFVGFFLSTLHTKELLDDVILNWDGVVHIQNVLPDSWVLCRF